MLLDTVVSELLFLLCLFSNVYLSAQLGDSSQNCEN